MKSLYRLQNDRIIAGVCGGIAEYLNIDPVIVRIMAVALALLNGLGVILYIIGVIAMPEKASTNETKKTKTVHAEIVRRDTGYLWLGGILIALGLVFLLQNYIPWFSIAKLWPLFLVVAGVLIIVRKKE